MAQKEGVYREYCEPAIARGSIYRLLAQLYLRETRKDLLYRLSSEELLSNLSDLLEDHCGIGV